MNKLDAEEEERGPGYVQLFVYRVPEKKREDLHNLLTKIAKKLREHGTLLSEFYRLHSNEAFPGFAPIATTFAPLPGEELWVELDHYIGREHRDRVMAELSRDADAGALFRQLRPLVSDGFSIVIGEFDGMQL